MDRIEKLIKGAKPRVELPDAAAGRDSARSVAFSSDPDVVRRAGRTPAQRDALRTAAAALLAGAAIVGAFLVGGNFLPQPAPGPAQTGSPASTDPVSPGDSPRAPTNPAGTAGAVPSTGGVECIMANVDQQRDDRERVIRAVPASEQAYYTVLGCAEGWIAYSISDEGVRALELDGGNAWYQLARLQNGRFLSDFRQEWASVFNWEFQALNNEGLTPQQAMDKEFAEKRIPVELRPRLVGEGPPAK